MVERDIAEGKITEEYAQELDGSVCNETAHGASPSHGSLYNEIFRRRPNLVTRSIAGTMADGRHKVTKTSFRFLQTHNLGPSPEPNMTVLYGRHAYRKRLKNSVQSVYRYIFYSVKNDDLMQSSRCSDDYEIACCVSYQKSKTFGSLEHVVTFAETFVAGSEPGTLRNQWKTGYHRHSCTEIGYCFDLDEVMENFKLAMQRVSRVCRFDEHYRYMHDKYY